MWSAIPSSRALVQNAVSSSHAGSCPPISRADSASTTAPERLADGLEVLGRRQPLARSEQVRAQPVQVRVTPLLVHIEVTLRVERNLPVPAPLTVDPERDLLSHRPRRHPHCRLFAEQLGDASLEPFRERALTIEVDLVVRELGLDRLVDSRQRLTRRRCSARP